MSILDTAFVAVHHVFGALWVGSVLFVTYAILPQARDGDVGPDVLRTVFGKLTMVTRVSAFLLLVTGGHLAGNLYTVDSLLGTQRGWLVLTKIGLWFVLAGLVEAAAKKFTAELDEGRLRGPANEYATWFYAASIVGLLLYVNVALLTWGIPF